MARGVGGILAAADSSQVRGTYVMGAHVAAGVAPRDEQVSGGEAAVVGRTGDARARGSHGSASSGAGETVAAAEVRPRVLDVESATGETVAAASCELGKPPAVDIGGDKMRASARGGADGKAGVSNDAKSPKGGAGGWTLAAQLAGAGAEGLNGSSSVDGAP